MNTHQTCWQILNIEPVRDKKTIKRAYAKLLKVTRPDEDPTGFKALHGAYEEALSYIEQDWYWEDASDYDDYDDDEYDSEQQVTETLTLKGNLKQDDFKQDNLEEPIAETTEFDISKITTQPPPIAVAPEKNSIFTTTENEVTTENQAAPSEVEETSVLENTASFHDHSESPDHTRNEALETSSSELANLYINQTSLQDDFTKKLYAHLATPAMLNNLNSWQTLLAHEALYDIQFKKEISMQVLSEILDTRQEQIEQVQNNTSLPPSYYSQPTLVFLSDYFGWQHAHEEIEYNFYYHSALNQFYDDLEEDNKYLPNKDPSELTREDYMVLKLPLASLHKRILAFFIDLGLILLVILPLKSLVNITNLNALLFIMIMLCICLIPAWQQSKTKHKASPGQRLLKLQLVTLDLQAVSFETAINRNIYAFFITLFSIAMFINSVGFVFWLIYFIYKYSNNDRITWLDKKNQSYVIEQRTD